MRKSALLLFLAGALIAAPLARPQQPLAVLHPNDVIVFQGDSITDGGRLRTGTDPNHTMGQDYAYILAAQINAEYPERNLTFINRGDSGDRILDLAARWQADTLDLKPNFLSILVGINDTEATDNRAETVDQFEKNYDLLIVKTMAALPGTKIVLGEPFILPVGKRKDTYATESVEVQKRQAVVAKLAAKYHLPLVRYQDALDQACTRAPADHWTWDGIHPTWAGHALMAQEWLKTVSAFWPNG